MTEPKKNQAETMRAWEEFGRPLAGSTVGNPPRTRGKERDWENANSNDKKQVKNRQKENRAA